MILIILVFTNPTLSYAQNTVYKYAKTTVNIRRKPNTQCKIIGQLQFNDRIRVIKRVNKKWYLVIYKNQYRYVAAQYLSSKKNKYISFSSPSNSTFKSYEDADCITDDSDITQGKLKEKYHLDMKSGVYMVGDRYCIAIGSYFTNKIGVKVDLVIYNNKKKHVLKCITVDSKADKDTVNNHQIHKDGSIVEFVVNTEHLPREVKRMGDISYSKKIFRGSITGIRVYE